jgi:hypothetical protein
VVECALCRELLRRSFEANGTELHVHDRVMAVATLGRRRETQHESRRHARQHALEAGRGYVMAFVNNDLAVAVERSRTELAAS